MKHITQLFLLILFTFAGTAVFAQSDRDKDRNEHIQAAKTAFLTDKMGLTPAQSQKFWPLYNEYQGKRHAIYEASKSLKRADLDKMSEQEIRAMIDGKFDRDQQVLNLEKEYAAKFQKVISVRQLAQLYRSEREFMKLLLQRLDDKQASSRN
ncbi:Spy/CpxP family protein refolding chaperone [Pontibacter chitinilyticus]|uniref:Spy/CpxP family protein refolding chaperone n=1 Tax=Pontibacter chitinilyticus TaxID=2674989 RepID=UPI00321A4843